MKIFRLIIASLVVSGCGPDESDAPREDTAGKRIAEDYNRQMDEARNVEIKLQEQKRAIDEALETSESGEPDAH